MVETRERERIHLCADSIVDSAQTVADVRCAPTVKPFNVQTEHFIRQTFCPMINMEMLTSRNVCVPTASMNAKIDT